MSQTIRTRSPFLVAAAVAANAWLLAFGLDAAISTVEEVLRGLAGVGGLIALRNFVATLVVLGAVPMALLLVFVPHLPKRVFLAPVLFAFWGAFGSPPFEIGLATHLAGFLAAFAQLALFAMAMGLVRLTTGRWLLRAADLPVKTRLLRRFGLALAGTVAALLVALPALGAVALAQTIETQTGGYLRFTARSVEAGETVLKKGPKTVRLVGMVHIGEGRFYRDLFQSFPPGAVVLAEGVSDREGKLQGKFSYARTAKALGLSDQAEVQAAWMAQVARGAQGAGAAPAQPPVRIVRADVDVSDFAPKTIDFLKDIAGVYGAPSLWQAYTRLTELDGRYQDADVKAVFADLIDRRNAALVATLDRELAAHDVIVVPWGAEHMPGIEKALKERGFEIASRRTLTVVAYGELI
jgi:hypothetical protein